MIVVACVGGWQVGGALQIVWELVFWRSGEILSFGTDAVTLESVATPC